MGSDLGPDFGLAGKKILVLGGGQGMGESTSLLLAAAGADVAVADLEVERAERVAAAVTAAGTRGYPLVVDVTDDDALVGAIARTETELGPLDGLVTIIGMAAWARLVDMTTETWDLDHRRNLRYFFLSAREVARSLIARGAPGSIVCVASIDGIRSAAGHASYGAAKAGLVNLVKTMTAEWSGHGIRVNAVAPGAMITPRIPERSPEEEAEMMSTVPMHRRGTTDDIGKAALFFLSDLSTYVSGQTLAVDGGFTAVGPLDYTANMPLVDVSGPGGTIGLQ
ncbi:MAG TPA: SDR family oxidoreductase [Acidimicrobiia bacterium]|jgi:NAD(P)-dependent dehydrogenase (short-subunit alcohol dehydrogenase family)